VNSRGPALNRVREYIFPKYSKAYAGRLSRKQPRKSYSMKALPREAQQ